MNPNARAYESLRRWQKALRLRDSDTQLVQPPDQASQPPPDSKDVEFYQKQYQEAIARNNPLSAHDRRELNSLKQVLHLRDEDVQAIEEIEQQHAPTTLQTNETTVEPPRGIADATVVQNPISADANPAPPAIGLGTEPSGSERSGAEPPETEQFRTEPTEVTPAAAHPVAMSMADLEQALSQLSPAEQAVIRQKLKQEEAEGAGGADAGETGQPAAHSDPPPTSEAVAPSAIGQSPAPHPESAATTAHQSQPNYAQPGSADPAATDPSSPALTTTTPASSPAATPPPPRRQVAGSTVKADRRPLLITTILVACTLGILAGAWLAAKTYLVPAPRDPVAARSHFDQGTALAKQGQNAKAIAEFDQAIRLDPKDANFFLNRGVAYYQAGNLSAALNDYTEALKLNPKLAEAFSNRSQVHVTEQRYDDANKDASQALQINPNLIEAYLNRGNALFGKNNLDGASQDYQKVLQSTDAANRSKAYNNLGNVSAARNQLDAAISNYDQAIQLVRSYADAYFNRALALDRKKRCPEAVQGFQDAATLYQTQGNREMSQRAQRNVARLQQCATPPSGSPQPSPSS